jgi:hypothetical protein
VNVVGLRGAYDRFIDTVEGGSFRPPADGEWGVDLVLAHVIVADRLVAQTVADVLAGRHPAYSNRASLSVPYLEAIVRAAGDRATLLESVRRGSEELASVAACMTPAQAAAVVPVVIASGDKTVVDAPMSVAQLVAGAGRSHLSLHQAQLESLRD